MEFVCRDTDCLPKKSLTSTNAEIQQCNWCRKHSHRSSSYEWKITKNYGQTISNWKRTPCKNEGHKQIMYQMYRNDTLFNALLQKLMTDGIQDAEFDHS